MIIYDECPIYICIFLSILLDISIFHNSYVFIFFNFQTFIDKSQWNILGSNIKKNTSYDYETREKCCVSTLIGGEKVKMKILQTFH